MADLGQTLEAAYQRCDAVEGVARDPVRFVHRYASTADREVAGVFASQLAYGRVSLFGPVLESFFAIADEHGGPRAWVDGYEPSRDRALAGLMYRWNRPIDWSLMTGALQVVLREHGTLEAAFAAPTAAQALNLGIGRIRSAAAAAHAGSLPRGFRYWLASPDNGSTCKRWNMFLRWMVRSPREGIDLGLWSTPTPEHLVMPVDTHVFRIARFLGLTQRKTANWRTAEEITRSLLRFDPHDPVRYDFALAHIGISGGCRGHRDPVICPDCPLDPLCRAPNAA